MKKTNRLSKYIILLLISLLLVSCGKEKEKAPRWDVYNPHFVDYFSNVEDIAYRNISQLTAYYYENYYYYVAVFTHENRENEDFVYEVLYLWEDYDGVPGSKIFFPIKDEKDCYEYFPEEYKRFLSAKENGVSKSFTQEEISKMINDFYGKEIK